MLAALLGGLLGRVAASAQATTYRSEVRTSVRFIAAKDAGQPSPEVIQSRVLSYKDLAGTEAVARRVHDRLRTTRSERELLGSMLFDAPTGTSDIIIAALSPDAQDAQSLAQVWTDMLSQKVAQVEELAPSPTGSVKLVQITPASTPSKTEPIAASMATGIGSVLGLLLAAVLLVANALVRPRIYTSQQLVTALGVPVVTALPHVPRFADPGAQAAVVTDPQFLEAITILSSHLHGSTNTPSLIVVPGREGAGATTVSEWVARTFADEGREVVLYHLPQDAPVHVVLEDVARRDRVVVIDCPPVISSATAQAIAQHVDAALLVLDARDSRMSDAQTALARLADSGAHGLGIVVNHIGRTRQAAARYDMPWPGASPADSGGGRR
ncbi:hypothetical protein [Arsenicicoccus dermatophilus]|uniref:hypothetical protein n=1 Tax=Arsenicicoccus dermatophilus TaxID=1076331 RepID=UPI001F4CBC1A|nr:hypothetical protein [Arsenicicoccus dermatophilus]MCH8611643.1 hypothetical protein [Arsenicicoccus dermatophilus]